MSKCRNFLICRISATCAFASIIRLPTLLGTSCTLSVMMFYVVAECIDFPIRCIITSVSLTSHIISPPFFGTSRRLSNMTFIIMSECSNFFLYNQDFVAYRAMFTFCKPFLCASRLNGRIDHVNMFTSILFPFHINIDILG